MNTYDDSNIFAKILRGEIPAVKLFEDRMTYAFMDIMPRADGHALVIPKAPSRNILDVEPGDLAAVMTTTQKIARAQMKGFGADGITLQQFSEQAGGQMVFHLHVHIIPRFDGIRLGPHTGTMADKDVLEKNAAIIRAAL